MKQRNKQSNNPTNEQAKFCVTLHVCLFLNLYKYTIIQSKTIQCIICSDSGDLKIMKQGKNRRKENREKQL